MGLWRAQKGGLSHGGAKTCRLDFTSPLQGIEVHYKAFAMLVMVNLEMNCVGVKGYTLYYLK